MAYFAAIKITDENGKVVYMADLPEFLYEMYVQLKILNAHMESITDKEITEEDVE